MTKAEQARLWAWRFKVVRQALERSGTWPARADISAFPGKPSIAGNDGLTPMAKRASGIGPGDPTARRPRPPPEVVSKILYLRQRYHFGPAKIADYLRRFHQLSLAVSSVHRILFGTGMNRLPANQKHRSRAKRWQRYEKPQPGHRLQMDVKFLERIPGTRKRLYQFTAIDDCTRIRMLKVYDACHQGTAIQFVDEVLRRLPFRVYVIQTDNGAEFQSRFHWHLEARDIRHVYIRPRTPHLNGKVERSHRVDDQEFYQLLDKDGITDEIHLFNEKLREWGGLL